jgi:hypothetical protein
MVIRRASPLHCNPCWARQVRRSDVPLRKRSGLGWAVNPKVYDCTTKSWGQRAEDATNHENWPYIGKGEAQHRKYKRLKLGGGHLQDF